MPLVVEFNHETAQKIFKGLVKSHILFFMSKKDEGYEDRHKVIHGLAEKRRNEIQFVVIDIDEDDNRRVLEFLGLKEEAMPAIRIIQMKETDIIKYKPESTAIEEDNIRGFIEDFNAGKVPVHYLSEKTPEDWDSKPVKVGWAMNDTNGPISSEENFCCKFRNLADTSPT